MPGLLPIIEAVALNPTVDASVAQLLTALFAHLQGVAASGNQAAIHSTLAEGVNMIPNMVTAVLANTKPTT